MTVTRISEMIAQPGKGEVLKNEFAAILPKIRAHTECLSCEILVDAENADRVLIIEQWSSIDAHQDAVSKIDRTDFEKVINLMASQPSGKYYSVKS